MEAGAPAGGQHLLVSNNFSSSMASFLASPPCQLDPWQCQAEGLGGETTNDLSGMLSPASVWATLVGRTWMDIDDEKPCSVEAIRPPPTPSICLGPTTATAAELLEMLTVSMAQQDQNSGMRWQGSSDTANDSFGQPMDGRESVMNHIKTILEVDPVGKQPCTALQLRAHNQDGECQEKCVQVDTLQELHILAAMPLEDEEQDDALEDPGSPDLPLESLVHPEDLLEPLSIPQDTCAHKSSQPTAPQPMTEDTLWGIRKPLMRSLSRQRVPTAKAALAPKQKPVDYSKSPPIEQIVKLLGIIGRWRKYGRKMMRDCPYPAHYYKCTIRGCGAKRKVWYDHKGELKVFGKGDDHTHKSISTIKAAAHKDDDRALYSPPTAGQLKGKKSTSKQSGSAAAESASRKRKHARGGYSRAGKVKPTSWPRQPNPSWRFRDAGIKVDNAPRESKQDSSTYMDEGTACALKPQEAASAGGSRRSLGLLHGAEGGHGVSTSRAPREEGAGGYSECRELPQPKFPGELEELTFFRDELAREVVEGGFDPESLIFAPSMLRQHSWRRMAARF